MIGQVSIYAIAAGLDIRYRWVPNELWIVLLAVNVYTGVPIGAWAAAAYLGGVLYALWRWYDIGGADVKALVLLPVSFPVHWVTALVVCMAIATAWTVLWKRDEVPPLVPVAVGIATAVTATVV